MKTPNQRTSMSIHKWVEKQKAATSNLPSKEISVKKKDIKSKKDVNTLK